MSKRSRFDILLQEPRRHRKACVVCGRALASSYADDTCEECKYDALYKKVREFVENNDVGEYEVAEEFDIPVETVRRWVKLGYMDYKKPKNE